MEKIKVFTENGEEVTVQFSKSYHRDGTLAPDLINVVLQNYINGEVLLVGTMSQEAYYETVRTGKICLYSRSRKCLWRKGETSGDELEVEEVFVNCESNCLLFKVHLNGGGACHTRDENGRTRKSCFYRKIF